MRDLRDPRQFPDLRLAYQTRRIDNEEKDMPFHEFVDKVMSLTEVPDYPKHETMATIAKEAYQNELQTRAAEGDPYAKSLLDGYTWDEPN